MAEIKENDIWIIHFLVPYKEKNDSRRPFIVLKEANNKFYDIPLTSFKPKRYKKELGAMIINKKFLSKKSIIKPSHLITTNRSNFVKKCGEISPETNLKIKQAIEKNMFDYLNLKNINAINREFIIEEQRKKIADLELENQQLKLELAISKEEVLLNKNDKIKELNIKQNVIKNENDDERE